MNCYLLFTFEIRIFFLLSLCIPQRVACALPSTTADCHWDIAIWNAATGHLEQTLLAHTELITNLTPLLGGRLLASCSDDGTVKLWRYCEPAQKQRDMAVAREAAASAAGGWVGLMAAAGAAGAVCEVAQEAARVAAGSNWQGVPGGQWLCVACLSNVRPQRNKFDHCKRPCVAVLSEEPLRVCVSSPHSADLRVWEDLEHLVHANVVVAPDQRAQDATQMRPREPDSTNGCGQEVYAMTTVPDLSARVGCLARVSSFKAAPLRSSPIVYPSPLYSFTGLFVSCLLCFQALHPANLPAAVVGLIGTYVW